MKRSMIAPACAGAVTLALGGYVVGATRHGGGPERSATCEQANHEFTTRAGQYRKHQQLVSFDDDDVDVQSDLDATQVKILSVIVVRNPTCFDAGTRAEAAILRQHPTEEEVDVAARDLTATAARSENCFLADER
ncbi:hypothetical protein ACGFWD_37620 [Streptomyces sp. NPDC048448]|uniref:hypothetical protein n=1 Tax=unclassified Streptomyces TaxID=2593676 RepID=UPI00143E99C8|nr:hypothetical protein [Streptomyces sp. RPA4-2]QIY66887.1 hypothetical protein HEP85_42325 [Streptomyces sp. RPA4-2]